jgi:hypothetical protein
VNKADIEAKARAQVRADEAAITGDSKRRSVSLSGAWLAFWRHPSPFMIAPLFVGSLVARLIVGGWQWSDAWLPFVMIAAFPIFE